MSVIMEFAMFPTQRPGGASEYVSRIIKMIKDSGYNYQLTPMGTIIETETIEEALEIIAKSYKLLEPDCDRVYSVIKFDIRKGRKDGMKQKIESIENKIGKVNC